jgi:bloom syndrome protein
MTFRGDTASLEFLIDKGTQKETMKRRKLYKLNQIKQYTKCKECRKKYLFALLGEQFTPEQCKKTCDFCAQGLTSEIIELDYTEAAMKIMTELVSCKVKLTHRQLANLLQGRDVNMKDKVAVEQVKKILGSMKHDKIETIELMIQTLINEKLLLPKMVMTGVGKFKRKIEYLVPCSKV